MQITIYAAIHSLFAALIWLRSDGGCDPHLELMLVALGKVARTGNILRHAMNLIDDSGEGFFQTPFDQGDCKMRKVDTNPLPVELLRRMDRCPAAAKWIKYNVAFVRRSR